jgi:hypothetical protein
MAGDRDTVPAPPRRRPSDTDDTPLAIVRDAFNGLREDNGALRRAVDRQTIVIVFAMALIAAVAGVAAKFNAGPNGIGFQTSAVQAADPAATAATTTNAGVGRPEQKP